MKLIKRGLRYLGALLALYVLVILGTAAWQFATARSGPIAEAPFDAKAPLDPLVMEIVESARKLVNVNRTPEYQRDVHAKAHGCVKATFEVPTLDARYAHGVFAEPGRYKAWIRFSNGATPSFGDGKEDARGMAIKLMGVAGDKLLRLEKHEKTQDFIMINSPVFFIETVEEYAVFMKRMSMGDRFGYFFGEWSPNPLKWRLRQLVLAARTLKHPPISPLTAQYFSLSPYKLGADLNIKYSARACETYEAVGIDRSQPNFLRDAMKHHLRERSACFDFMVQPQRTDRHMPIEDTTVEWKEEDSRFVTVARIHIPEQEFDTAEQNEFCENLSFTVWHSLDAHRPISAINRLRRELYANTAAYRRGKNGAPMHEPRGWCLDLTGAGCDSPAGESAALAASGVDDVERSDD